MPDVSLTFDSQSADLDRRMRMAQALEQQAQSPIEIMRYNGFAAQPSKVGGLAKILAAYYGGKTEKRVSDERSALTAKDNESARTALAQALGGGQPAPEAPSAAGLGGIIAALQGQGSQGAQGMGFDPSTGVRPQPMPQAPRQAPQSPQAMMQAGLQMGLGGGPASQYAGQALTQMAQGQMARQDAAQIHQQDRQDQIEQHRQEIADASTQKEAEKADDIKRAQGMVTAIRGQLRDDSQKALFDAAALNGTGAVTPLITQVAANGFKDRFGPATADDLKGYPHGTTGQKNLATGELVHVYNPHDDLNADAQLRISQQNADTARISATKPTQASMGRPIPQAAAKGIIDSRTNLNTIARAVDAIKAYPQGLGLKNLAADAIMQRHDERGNQVRALVADIGSLKIHDRSGAAVSPSEFPRLRPFIPKVTDSPDTTLTKLANFQAEYAAMIDETEGFYSPANGYRELPEAATAQAPTTVTPPTRSNW